LPELSQYEERDLLLQIAEGDESAFAIMVKKYSGLLFTYLIKLTKDRDIASDVVQDIFTQLWLTHESLRNVESFRSWLFVISRNHAVRMLKNIDKEYKFRQEWWRLTQPYANGLMAQEQAALREAYDAMVHHAIHRLPPQQQKVWILSRQNGKKYAEIAEEMNISRETVKKYLQLASSSIADYVKNHGLPLVLTYLIMEL
jgi:RNA polymerase sigma-70 factor (ECF subfamily)